jgi:hypothetical protein
MIDRDAPRCNMAVEQLPPSRHTDVGVHVGPPTPPICSREDRSKLLRLHYEDKISADLFAEEERRLFLPGTPPSAHQRRGVRSRPPATDPGSATRQGPHIGPGPLRPLFTSHDPSTPTGPGTRCTAAATVVRAVPFPPLSRRAPPCCRPGPPAHRTSPPGFTRSWSPIPRTVPPGSAPRRGRAATGTGSRHRSGLAGSASR